MNHYTVLIAIPGRPNIVESFANEGDAVNYYDREAESVPDGTKMWLYHAGMGKIFRKELFDYFGAHSL